jgi:hypothetical protein
MGCFDKLKFWKKRTTKTPPKEDGCVSAKDRRICDDAKVSMDPTVMRSVHTQTRMSSCAAVKVKHERKLELKNQRIRKLEEELAVSKRLTADLMLNMKGVEEQVRKYAEMPVISQCDYCECKKQVPASTDLCEKFISTDLDAKNSKPEITSGRSTESDSETPTEAKGRQMDCANADEEETERRVFVIVEEYERKIGLLNEQIEHLLSDPTSHIDIKRMYEEGNRRQVEKIREMGDELTWCKEQLLASLGREDILQRYLWYCYLKSDKPLNSSSSNGGGGSGSKSSRGGGGGVSSGGGVDSSSNGDGGSNSSTRVDGSRGGNSSGGGGSSGSGSKSSRGGGTSSGGGSSNGGGGGVDSSSNGDGGSNSSTGVDGSRGGNSSGGGGSGDSSSGSSTAAAVGAALAAA